MRLAGVTGLIYGAALKPVSAAEADKSGFWNTRALNGLSDGLTFTALGFTNSFTSRMLGTAAGAVAGSEIPKFVSQPLDALLRSPLAAGALSGIPGGTVSAEINAWRHGQSYASVEELKESIHGMIFVGAAFGAGQWLSAQRGGTSVTNARYLLDGTGLTRSAEENAGRANFTVLDPPGKLDLFQASLESSANRSQISVTARQHILGLFSVTGLFPYKLGDARSMLLYHDVNSSVLSAHSAGSAGLIASCLPLEPSIANRDVFPNRATFADQSVFYSRVGPRTFSLATTSGAVGDSIFAQGNRVDRADSQTPDVFEGPARSFKLGISNSETEARQFLDKVTRGKSTSQRLDEISADPRAIVSGIAQSVKRGAMVVDKMLDAGANADDLTSSRLRPLVSLFDHIEPTPVRVERAMNAQREQVRLDDLPAFIDKATERPEKRRRINLIEQELDNADKPSRLLSERILGVSALNETFGSKSQVVNYLLSLERQFEPSARESDRFISSIAKFLQPEPDRYSFSISKRPSAESLEQARKSVDIVRRLAENGAPKESFSPEFLGLYKKLEQVLGKDDLLKDKILAELPDSKSLKPVVEFLSNLSFHKIKGLQLRNGKQSEPGDVSVEQLLRNGMTGEQLNSLSELAHIERAHPSLWGGAKSLLSFVYPPLSGYSGELSNRIAAMESGGMSRDDAVLLHTTLMQSTLNDYVTRNLKIIPDPLSLIPGLDPEVFSQASKLLVPDNYRSSSYSEQFGKLFYATHDRANTPLLALKLSLLFDRDWKPWLDQQQSQTPKIGDIETSLPLSSRQSLEGLSNLLLEHPQLSSSNVELLSDFWAGLSSTARSQPLNSLLEQLASVKSRIKEASVDYRLGFNRFDYPMQERAAIGIVNAGLGGLSAQEQSVLFQAFSHKNNISDATAKLQADPDAKLDDAIEGWKLDPSMPLSLAEKAAQTKPFWKRLVARQTWFDRAEDTWNDGDFDGDGKLTEQGQAGFDARFEAGVALGRNAAGMLSRNAVEATQALHPNLIEADQYLVAHAVNHLSLPEQLKVVSGLNAGAFSKALTHLEPDGILRWEIDERRNGTDVLPLNKLMEQMNAGANWQHSSAVKLVSTFGNEWKTWLTKMSDMSVTEHDATFWLPLSAPADAPGLGSWLMKNVSKVENLSIKLSKRELDREGNTVISQEDITGQEALQSVAGRWSALNVVERKLPFRELVTLARSSEYSNYVDHEFAQQSARAGVAGGKEAGQFEYNQHRFLASLETPSPFPKFSASNSPWTSGDLVGFFLPRRDPRGLYLGRLTGCCQHPNDAARTAAWYGQESPLSGFFAVVDKNAPQKIVAQSWAWVSSNGGLVFDSVESRGLADRGADVSNVYDKAAKDLVRTDFHTVSVAAAGNAWKSLDSTKWQAPAKGEAMTLAAKGKPEYIYSDASLENQRVIAKNPSLPKAAPQPPLSWLSGALLSESPDANRIAAQVYGNKADNSPSGDFSFLLHHRDHGVIGYATLDTSNLHINDIAVSPEYRDAFSNDFAAKVLNHAGRTGHEWTADVAKQTAYAPLKALAAAGKLEITGESQDTVRTQGSDPVYRIKFKGRAVADAKSERTSD